MPESYSTRRRSRRPFIVTPYVLDSGGHLAAEMPSCCPVAADGSGHKVCKLSVHDRRGRKTGPEHQLTVVACGTHGCGFTLYPPGYAPYRRQPVVRLSPAGAPVESEGDDKSSQLSGTLFEAAVDARHGRAWARSSGDGVPDRWWGTQGRHLDLASRLVGVARGLADRIREAISAVLSVGTLVLRETSRAEGYRAIGKAVCQVLQRLRGPRRAVHLLTCGHLIGHWGEPLHWDAGRRVIERSPFSTRGTMVVT
jgi:hypothetical protein